MAEPTERPNDEGVLTIPRLEVVDDEGYVRAVLGALGSDPGSFGLALYDEAGAERASLDLSPHGPALSMAMGGNVVLQVGVFDPYPTGGEPGAYVVLTDQDGVTAFRIHVDPDGAVSITGVDQ